MVIGQAVEEDAAQDVAAQRSDGHDQRDRPAALYQIGSSSHGGSGK